MFFQLDSEKSIYVKILDNFFEFPLMMQYAIFFFFFFFFKSTLEFFPKIKFSSFIASNSTL
jgi:hypothetical protein